MTPREAFDLLMARHPPGTSTRHGQAARVVLEALDRLEAYERQAKLDASTTWEVLPRFGEHCLNAKTVCGGAGRCSCGCAACIAGR